MPPPPGEADAYNARTRIGEMPPELMAELRAEGLMPNRSDAERAGAQVRPPDPAGPGSSGLPPASPTAGNWPAPGGRRPSQAIPAIKPEGAGRGGSGPVRRTSSSSLAARLATEARSPSGALPRRPSTGSQPAIRRTASSQFDRAVPQPKVTPARPPGAAQAEPSPRQAAYLAAGFTVDEVPTAPTRAALDPRAEPAAASRESGARPRPSTPVDAAAKASEEPWHSEPSDDLERPPVTDSQTLSRPPGAHLKTPPQPPGILPQGLSPTESAGGPPLQLPSSGEVSSGGEVEPQPALVHDVAGERATVRRGRWSILVALALVVLLVGAVVALSLHGQ